ncbi:MAG: 6-hydroxymethylpterin diphosphokinase MptE-like protein [Thermoplasmatota archaeon]
MEWRDWEATAAGIRAEFGYPVALDRAAALELKALSGPMRWRDLGVLVRNRRNVTIVGCGPGLVAATAEIFEGKVVVACDGATQRLRHIGVVPELVVTDLDGDPEALKWAASQGSSMVVHAHGDNRRHVAALVPHLGPLLYGTHQVAPEPELEPLRNWGGFTDGDRAVLLCEGLGALAALLVGFEFEADPSPYSHRWDPATKPAKLRWAKAIVSACQARGSLQMRRWVP